MKILLDMNLSPAWCAVLEMAGYEAGHWMHIGAQDAEDTEILQWVKSNGYVLFTHDLDFGAILAATSAKAPSVIQLRAQDPTPDECADTIIHILQLYEDALLTGALISVDRDKARVHILPLR